MLRKIMITLQLLRIFPVLKNRFLESIHYHSSLEKGQEDLVEGAVEYHLLDISFVFVTYSPWDGGKRNWEAYLGKRLPANGLALDGRDVQVFGDFDGAVGFEGASEGVLDDFHEPGCAGFGEDGVEGYCYESSCVRFEKFGEGISEGLEGYEVRYGH